MLYAVTVTFANMVHRTIFALSVLLFASTFASLLDDGIPCSDLESISVNANQMTGMWLVFEYYKASESVTDNCTLVDDKAPSSDYIEAHTQIYTNGSLVFDSTSNFVADGNRWKFLPDKKQELLVASVDTQQYIAEVVCDSPADPSQSKVLYAATFRRVGVTLDEETVNKLRGDVKNLLGLPDLGTILQGATYCEPKLDQE